MDKLIKEIIKEIRNKYWFTRKEGTQTILKMSIPELESFLKSAVKKAYKAGQKSKEMITISDET